MPPAAFSDLVGKTIVALEKEGDSKLRFYCGDGSIYEMYHIQDCCEKVFLEDVDGELAHLVGHEIIVAEARYSGQNPPGVVPEYEQDSFTWTFYTIRTNRDSVTLRWYGESNGYYSENVDFELVKFPNIPALSESYKEELRRTIHWLLEKYARSVGSSTPTLRSVLETYPAEYLPLIVDFINAEYTNLRAKVTPEGISLSPK